MTSLDEPPDRGGKVLQCQDPVVVAENGAVALECIARQRPTIIISDVEMPKMTGYELCSAVKGDPELRSIPFILLSTLSEPQDIIKGLHCGAESVESSNAEYPYPHHTHRPGSARLLPHRGHHRHHRRLGAQR